MYPRTLELILQQLNNIQQFPNMIIIDLSHTKMDNIREISFELCYLLNKYKESKCKLFFKIYGINRKEYINQIFKDIKYIINKQLITILELNSKCIYYLYPQSINYKQNDLYNIDKIIFENTEMIQDY